MSINTLTIKDYLFTINSASISQSKDEQGNFRWDINIEAEGRKVDGVLWSPKIYGENMKVDAPDLNNIVGKEIWIKEAYNYVSEEHLLKMYIFEHEDIWDSKIKFLARNGNKLLISWEGKCNIHWNDKYGENVPFKIETQMIIEE